MRNIYGPVIAKSLILRCCISIQLVNCCELKTETRKFTHQTELHHFSHYKRHKLLNFFLHISGTRNKMAFGQRTHTVKLAFSL